VLRQSPKQVLLAQLAVVAETLGHAVLDVRPEDEFAFGHLRGAASASLRTLKARLSELNPAKEIIAYCRGSYCILSFEAVAMLRTHGFRPA
jgi:ArsR family transcriptional regulator